MRVAVIVVSMLVVATSSYVQFLSDQGRSTQTFCYILSLLARVGPLLGCKFGDSGRRATSGKRAKRKSGRKAASQIGVKPILKCCLPTQRFLLHNRSRLKAMRRRTRLPKVHHYPSGGSTLRRLCRALMRKGRI